VTHRDDDHESTARRLRDAAAYSGAAARNPAITIVTMAANQIMSMGMTEIILSTRTRGWITRG